jgi:hypothetical protein
MCDHTLSVMPPVAELVGPILSAKPAKSIVDRLPRAANWIADFCAAWSGPEPMGPREAEAVALFRP